MQWGHYMTKDALRSKKELRYIAKNNLTAEARFVRRMVAFGKGKVHGWERNNAQKQALMQRMRDRLVRMVRT
jgi:hypothetical protein